jgi:hypothetical protein
MMIADMNELSYIEAIFSIKDYWKGYKIRILLTVTRSLLGND